MPTLDRAPRLWITIGVPNVVENRGATYWPLSLDAMPPIGRAMSGTLHWLIDSPAHDRSLQRGPDDPAERDADGAGLQAVAAALNLPSAFRRFIDDPEPRRHVRSATACYLDLAKFAVRTDDGGTLVHFLSDQQWVLHWLLYVGPDDSEAVVVSSTPLGFDDGETAPVRELRRESAPEIVAVCSDSFEEFLYRLWIENEIWFSLVQDVVELVMLPGELQAYAAAYPRDTASWPWD